MHTTRYMTPTATNIVQFSAPEPRAFIEEFTLPWRSLNPEDVVDLLEAAGSLTVGDIAGGLDVPVAEIAHLVSSLVGGGDLREDEFGRYRLAGGYLQRAS